MRDIGMSGNLKAQNQSKFRKSQARLGQASGEHSFRERKQQTTSAMFARQVSRKHPEEQEEEQVEEQALTREQKEEDARLAHVM